jgi:hypothetical protein
LPELELLELELLELPLLEPELLDELDDELPGEELVEELEALELLDELELPTRSGSAGLSHPAAATATPPERRMRNSRRSYAFCARRSSVG